MDLVRLFQSISIDRMLKKEIKKGKKENKYCSKHYPDWVDNEYNCGERKFVWGIKPSGSTEASFLTLNDAELYYSRKHNIYYLEIETHLKFDNGRTGEIQHLDNILRAFSKYMRENHFSTNGECNFFPNGELYPFSGETIEEVYAKFKIFVLGYRAFYKSK